MTKAHSKHGEVNTRLLAACIKAEALIRNGGTVPIKGKTWAILKAAIKRATKGAVGSEQK